MRTVRSIHVGIVLTVALLRMPSIAQHLCLSSPEIERAVTELNSAKEHTAKGKYLIRHDRLDCAIQAFQRAIELDKHSWEPQFHLALAHLKLRKFKHAVPHLMRTLELRPQFFEARLALGSVLADLGDIPSATREFNSALNIKPESVEARYRLAKANIVQRRYRAAIKQLHLALQIRPDDLELRLLLGLAHSKTGEVNTAITLFTQLTQEEPGHFESRFNLATAYAQAEQFSEAAEQYKQAVLLDPENWRARFSAAKALINSNRHQEALEIVVNVHQPLSDEFDFHLVRGLAFRGLGRLVEAETSLRRAIELRSDSAEAQSQLGFVLSRQGNLEYARHHLELAKGLNPELTNTRYELLSVLKRLGDFKAVSAESELFEIRKRQENMQYMAENALKRASAYLEQGDLTLALQEYRQATQYDPKNAEGYYGVSLALARLDNSSSERVRALEKAIALDPGLAEAHNDLGIIYADTGKTSDAERLLQSALATNPQYVEANTNLGVLYARQRRNVEAEPLFQRAIEDDPNYAPAYINYGLTLAALGRFREATEALQKAEALEPNNLKTLMGLGMVYISRKQFEDVLPTLQKIAVLDPNGVATRLNEAIAACGECAQQFQFRKHLGLAYARSGKLAAAQKELHISSELNPGDTEIKKMLDWLRKAGENISREAP